MGEIDKIAQIAFMKLTDEEKTVCEQKIEQIKQSAAELLRANLAGVEPTTKLTTKQNYREDVVIAPSNRDDLLSNCKDVEQGAFVVPKIVE